MIKRLLVYLFIVLGFGLKFSGTTLAIPMKNNGQGDLILSDKILEKFYLYVTTKSQNNPLNFFITEDRNNVFIEIDKNTSDKRYSGSGPIARNLKKCQQKHKQKCFLFSNQRIVVWNNGINPIDAKKSKIKRKISYEEFIVRLKELGFYKDEKRIVEEKKTAKQKDAKKVSWQVFVKLTGEMGNNSNLPGYNVKESSEIKSIKDQVQIVKKVTDKALKKCENSNVKWTISLRGNKICTVTVVKYFDEENQKNNNKYVNLLGVKFDDLIITLNGLENVTSKKIDDQKIANEKKTQIAKVEPTVKPKKTNQDNEAPVIEIAEAITVNDADYEFQGKITDKAKVVFVEVDGRSVEVKNGNFTVKGYSPIDTKILIEAIDKWGNRSEPKIVKIFVDIKDTDIAEKLEPLNPSKIETKSSSSKVALIIGIENYSDIVKASYAKADAQYFKEYASKGLGVENKNIKLLVDEDATFININKVLKKWLVSKIKPNKTELIIYYAGHGLASKDGKELYLLPQDGDPDLLSITSISRTNLFSEIKSLNPKSVTIFLDACYSGSSRDQEILLADARPVRIVADEQEGVPENFTIFTASKLDQISSGLKEAKHGIFSYYLMKGLEGKADANNDKDITNGELLSYMDENVSMKASELGRKQNPSLSGDPDKVLISYR